MFRDLRIALCVPVFDEENKIGEVVRRVPRPLVDDLLVVDDGSRDGSAAVARAGGAEVIPLGRTIGVGAALREGFSTARKRGADVIVVCAGNNKDAPEEIPRLLEAVADGADFVQGSRFLPGGRHGGMPVYRRFATRLHPILFSAAARKRVTESTNGFRAFRTRLLDDPRIDLGQSWLDTYDLEVYLYFKAIRLGYVTREVPVTKIYPPRAIGYTKMPPVTGWWSMLRPVVMLGLGLRT